VNKRGVDNADTPLTRAERTLANRRRMVAAAYRCFRADGYLGTTLSAVAEEAGVAVQTLYFTFGTKAALLGEAIGAAIVGFDRWEQPPPEPIDIDELLTLNPWWQRLQTAPTSREALDIFVRNGVRIIERVGPLIIAMHGAVGDADAEAVVRLAEERRIASYAEAAHLIARKPGGLRTGVSVRAATDVLVVLFSAEVHHALFTGRGWSQRRCRSYLHQLLASQLLDADGQG
jgi:AcrR family transcriptional regulator